MSSLSLFNHEVTTTADLCSWEKALVKDDVINFIDFRRERYVSGTLVYYRRCLDDWSSRMSSLDSRSHELNLVAGQMIVDGMLAYGWTHECIAKTSSRLRNALFIHCPGLFASSATNTQLTGPDIDVSSHQHPPSFQSTHICASAYSTATSTPNTIDTVIVASAVTSQHPQHNTLPDPSDPNENDILLSETGWLCGTTALPEITDNVARVAASTTEYDLEAGFCSQAQMSNDFSWDIEGFAQTAEYYSTDMWMPTGIMVASGMT